MDSLGCRFRLTNPADRGEMQTKAPMHLPTPNIRIEFHQQISSKVVVDIKQLLISTLWNRNWSEEQANQIFKWRYGDLASGETLLAYDGDRLVAMVASFRRPYLSAGKLYTSANLPTGYAFPSTVTLHWV